jgi:hypothetical protein
MLSDHLIEFARRKERLIGRAEQQRTVIAAACLQWREPFGIADRGLAIARYLKAHPIVIVVVVSVVAVVGRRNLLRWAGRGWIVWRFWRSATKSITR